MNNKYYYHFYFYHFPCELIWLSFTIQEDWLHGQVSEVGEMAFISQSHLISLVLVQNAECGGFVYFVLCTNALSIWFRLPYAINALDSLMPNQPQTQ